MSQPLGLHISGFAKFIEDHPKVVSDGMTTSQINRQIIKLITHGSSKPFIDSYTKLKTKSGRPLVAPATVFVSHAWKYQFVDIVMDVLLQHSQKEPDAYFWFDLFTNDQNSVAFKDFDWFCNTFRNSIKDIGQVLLVLAPWDDPMPVKRAWCLFEIATTINSDEVKFLANLPHSEIRNIIPAMEKSRDCLIQALSDIQAENAEATSQKDKELIFEVIQKSDGGFEHVNEQVKKILREWYISRICELANDNQNSWALMLRTSEMMGKFGLTDIALKYAFKSLGVARNEGIPDQQMYQIYNAVAMAYQYVADNSNANEYRKKALDLMLSTVGENHPDVAESYGHTAAMLYNQGDLDKSLEFYHKALKIMINARGPDHQDVAVLYTRVASVYSALNKNDLAIDYSNKAIEIQRVKLGEKHPAMASAYITISTAYQSMGMKFEEALEYTKKALDIRKSTYGEQHTLTANCYTRMADIFAEQGDAAKAHEYYQRALAIKTSLYGKSHPDLDGLHCSLANIYKSNGELDKAMEHYEKSLSLKQAFFGESHPTMPALYNNMAEVYSLRKNEDKALEFQIKSLSVAENSLGAYDPHIMSTYDQVARKYHAKGDIDKALEYFNKALIGRKGLKGEYHPTVAGSYHNVGNIYAMKGEVDKAIECYTKEMEILDKLNGGQPQKMYGPIYNNLAALHQSKGDTTIALQYAKKIEEIESLSK